eukprot:TRINITY_DN21770_c0_g1_i1.p1 TRINITY_DN21770_c0_g1~~TRINITY_DN21770_c0_g1_i1.p1  ORF type:complete len:236 (+),score=23.45 TRINITY_DN21770_c0_g1_i1:61-708(+)
MSYTKEYAKSADGWFKGAWYYKPWYVRRQEVLPEKAEPSGLMGPKGMEWPKYPGGYKPTWEERSGVPGLYKAQGAPVSGFPAIKTGMMSGRNVWRGSKVLLWTIMAAGIGWSCMWLRHAHRFHAQISDEDKFRRWSTIAYLQANGDVQFYCNSSKLDMYCREHIDSIPGVNRSFYNQDNIWVPPLYETATPINAYKQATGNFGERPPIWSGFLTA